MKLKIQLSDADIRRALAQYIFDEFQVLPIATDLKYRQSKYSDDFWYACETPLRLEVEIER